MSHNEHECDYNVPIFIHFGLLRTPKKTICNLSLRGQTQSLPSLLNTVTCSSRCPLTCLVITSHLSGLKWTHYWVRDDEKSSLFGLKKKFRLRRAPSSGISLSGGQVSDGRLCRGLIVAAEHPHDMFYIHITSIWSGEDSVLGQRQQKNNAFWGLLSGAPPKVGCTLSLRGRTQSLPSLLNTVACPSRCPMTCLTLTSRLSDLERTQYWVRDDEKVDYLD